MTFLDFAIIVVFGGYGVLCWSLVPRTWRGEIPAAEQVRAASGLRGAWLRYRYLFGWSRTGVVHLLVVTGMLLTYLAVRLHDVVPTPAVYRVAGVIGLVTVGLLVLWGMVAAFHRPKFLVPPHLRAHEEG
ncbi:hypothetical protein [Crossiella sp. NPDC003009]